MFTRKDYFENKCSHREYMDQFVTDYIKMLVKNRIGMTAILNSTDEYLNDIPLKKWSSLHGCFKLPKDDNSLSMTVCIAKAAAWQLIKENKDK